MSSASLTWGDRSEETPVKGTGKEGSECTSESREVKHYHFKTKEKKKKKRKKRKKKKCHVWDASTQSYCFNSGKQRHSWRGVLQDDAGIRGELGDDEAADSKSGAKDKLNDFHMGLSKLSSPSSASLSLASRRAGKVSSSSRQSRAALGATVDVTDARDLADSNDNQSTRKGGISKAHLRGKDSRELQPKETTARNEVDRGNVSENVSTKDGDVKQEGKKSDLEANQTASVKERPENATRGIETCIGGPTSSKQAMSHEKHGKPRTLSIENRVLEGLQATTAYETKSTPRNQTLPPIARLGTLPKFPKEGKSNEGTVGKEVVNARTSTGGEESDKLGDAEDADDEKEKEGRGTIGIGKRKEGMSGTGRASADESKENSSCFDLEDDAVESIPSGVDPFEELLESAETNCSRSVKETSSSSSLRETGEMGRGTKQGQTETVATNLPQPTSLSSASPPTFTDSAEMTQGKPHSGDVETEKVIRHTRNEESEENVENEEEQDGASARGGRLDWKGITSKEIDDQVFHRTPCGKLGLEDDDADLVEEMERQQRAHEADEKHVENADSASSNPRRSPRPRPSSSFASSTCSASKGVIGRKDTDEANAMDEASDAKEGTAKEMVKSLSEFHAGLSGKSKGDVKDAEARKVSDLEKEMDRALGGHAMFELFENSVQGTLTSEGQEGGVGEMNLAHDLHWIEEALSSNFDVDALGNGFEDLVENLALDSLAASKPPNNGPDHDLVETNEQEEEEEGGGGGEGGEGKSGEEEDAAIRIQRVVRGKRESKSYVRKQNASKVLQRTFRTTKGRRNKTKTTSNSKMKPDSEKEEEEEEKEEEEKWLEVIDDSTGFPYYYNAITGECQWEMVSE